MNININLPTGLALFSLVALSAWSSPLPLAPTTGPELINSLPWTISEPGYYYLACNLEAAADGDGITVEADNVVIDLRGFTLKGQGAGGTGIGGDTEHVEVRNGSLENWQLKGIDLDQFTCLENLFIRDCGIGADLSYLARVVRCQFARNIDGDLNVGPQSMIEDCQARGSDDARSIWMDDNSLARNVQVRGGEYGITGGRGSRVEHCSVVGTDRVGYSVNDNSIIVDSVVNSSGGPGSVGMNLGDHVVARHCNVSGGTDVGIRSAEYTTLDTCAVEGTAGNGIRAGNYNLVKDCSVDFCNYEYQVDSAGLKVGEHTVVRGGAFNQNYGPGILFSGEGGLVENCTVLDNVLAGIVLKSGAVARHNVASLNEGPGIQGDGGGLLIQGNAVDRNSTGVLLTDPRSLLIDNRAGQNSDDNYSFPWGTTHGPIEDSPWILLEKDPQANFETR